MMRILIAVLGSLMLVGCAGTVGSFNGPLCSGVPVELQFRDRTDRQEGVSAGCRITHPDGTVEEAWINTGPKTTSSVSAIDQDTLITVIDAFIEMQRKE